MKRAFGAEEGMTVAGIALAVLATGFAYHAIERNDGVPKIGGADHLAIFAMPSKSRDKQLASGAIVLSEAPMSTQVDPTAPIDYVPTATIRNNPAERFQVQGVFRDRVVIQGPLGTVELRPGDIAKGLGRLQEIRLAQGRWTAVFVPESPINHNSR